MVFGVDGMASFYFDGRISSEVTRGVSRNSQVGRSEVRMNEKVVGTEGVLGTDKNGKIEIIWKN